MVFLASPSYAEMGAELSGVWVSDSAATTKFNEANVKLAANTVEFERQVYGHLSVTYAGGCAKYSMPDLDVTINRKRFHLVGFHEFQPYSVIKSTEREVVATITVPVSHERATPTYHFEGPNRMWVWTADMVNGPSQRGEREYLVRTATAVPANFLCASAGPSSGASAVSP